MLCLGFRNRSGVSDERRGLSNQPLRCGGLLTNFEVITEGMAGHRFPALVSKQTATVNPDCSYPNIALTFSRTAWLRFGFR